MRKLGVFFSTLVVALPLLAASCVTREVPAVETYYETEYRTEYKTETYAETQNVVVSSKQEKKYIQPTVKWNDRLSFTGPAGPYSYRVMRGGDWTNGAGDARCAHRNFGPNSAYGNGGFRCVGSGPGG